MKKSFSCFASTEAASRGSEKMRQMTTSGTLRRPNGGWNFYFYCLCASSERDEAFIISEEIYFAPARAARTTLID